MIKYTKTLTSITLAAMLLSGCGSSSSSSSDTQITTEENTTTPYLRVAVLDGGWDSVAPVAEKIAQSVVTNDESQTLGYPTNWVVAGANPDKEETYEASDLLPIPANGVSSATGKARVIELCNSAYAKMAIGTGRFHGPALPCEVSVHSDSNKTYIDMLNPDAIFSIFFTDINDSTGALEKIASDVKNEIRGMILDAIKDDAHTVSTQELGPKFTQSEIAQLTSPYIVYKYKNGSTFLKGVDDKKIAQTLITALGIDTATADTNVDGLSEGSAWRSGRPDPIAIPNIQVVEACSPKYAAKATALGNEYITALPCEFAVYVDESDETNQTIAVSILNPEFMFGTMFKGAVEDALSSGKITQDDVTEYTTLASTVKGDLETIWNHVAAEHNLTKID